MILTTIIHQISQLYHIKIKGNDYTYKAIDDCQSYLQSFVSNELDEESLDIPNGALAKIYCYLINSLFILSPLCFLSLNSFLIILRDFRECDVVRKLVSLSVIFC